MVLYPTRMQPVERDEIEIGRPHLVRADWVTYEGTWGLVIVLRDKVVKTPLESINPSFKDDALH